MSTIRIPYAHPPTTDPRPTPDNKKLATKIGRMLEAHIRKWCSFHHTYTPGTITLHYQPKRYTPNNRLHLMLTNALLTHVTKTVYPTAVVTLPALHAPGHTPRPLWLDIAPAQEMTKQ